MLQCRAGNLRRPISIKITLNPSSPSLPISPKTTIDLTHQTKLHCFCRKSVTGPPMLIIQLANWSASLRVVSHLHRLLGFKDCLDSGRLMAEIARVAWIALIALGKDDICIDFYKQLWITSLLLSCVNSCTQNRTLFNIQDLFS